MYDSTKIKQQDTPITLDYILSKSQNMIFTLDILDNLRLVLYIIVHLEKIKILHLEYSEVENQVNYYLKIMEMVNVEMLLNL